MFISRNTKSVKNPVIIWDGGAVVLDFYPEEMAKSFENGKYETQILSLFKSTYWRKFDRGDLKLQGLQSTCNELFGWSADQFKKIFYFFLSSLKPKWETIALIEKLNDLGYEQYYLSNGSTEYISYVKSDPYRLQHKFNIDTYFKGLLISADVGLAKPELEIYLKAIEEFKIRYRPVVFIDDNLQNVIAASCIPRWTGILFKNNISDLEADLSKQGIEVTESRRALPTSKL